MFEQVGYTCRTVEERLAEIEAANNEYEAKKNDGYDPGFSYDMSRVISISGLPEVRKQGFLPAAASFVNSSMPCPAPNVHPPCLAYALHRPLPAQMHAVRS